MISLNKSTFLIKSVTSQKGNGFFLTIGILILQNHDAKSCTKRYSSHRMPQISLKVKCLKPLICNTMSCKSHFIENTLMDDCHTQRSSDIVIFNIAKQIKKLRYYRSTRLVVRKSFLHKPMPNYAH